MHQAGASHRQDQEEVARRGGWGHGALAAAAGLAVLYPLVRRGGFDADGQVAFAALAAIALAVASVVDEQGVGRAARRLVPRILAALALVAAIGSAHSLVPAGIGIRLALVVGGYAVLMLVGEILTRASGPAPVTGVLVVAALSSGLVGLWAVARRDLPYAEYLDRAWRPGGTFEYPPTLALVTVGALPALGRAALCERRILAFVGAGGLAVAGMVTTLAGSQWALMLAVAVAAGMVASPERWLRAGRREALIVVLCVIACGLVAFGVAGGHSLRRRTDHDFSRLLALGACIVFAPMAVALSRAGSRQWRSAAAVGAAALAVLALVAGTPLVKRVVPADPLHGRGAIWASALATARDRPILGHGTGSYAAASAAHPAEVREQPQFAHNLPLELWVELGAVGLALGLALYAAVISAAVRAAPNPDAMLLIPFGIAFLVANLVDWSWHQPAAGGLWALAVGAVLALAPGRSSQARAAS